MPQAARCTGRACRGSDRGPGPVAGVRLVHSSHLDRKAEGRRLTPAAPDPPPATGAASSRTHNGRTSAANSRHTPQPSAVRASTSERPAAGPPAIGCAGSSLPAGPPRRQAPPGQRLSRVQCSPCAPLRRRRWVRPVPLVLRRHHAASRADVSRSRSRRPAYRRQDRHHRQASIHPRHRPAVARLPIRFRLHRRPHRRPPRRWHRQ